MTFEVETVTPAYADGSNSGRVDGQAVFGKSRRVAPNQKMGKVQRYRWTIDHKPGNVAFVPKHTLNIDPRYQRALNDAKRLEIAAGFNWIAFGALSVAKRADGSLWVLDGQHRAAGANSREDVTDVPCVIFDIPGSVEEEAAAFLALNTLRRSLTSKDTFRALLVNGDKAAVVAQELITMSGRSVDSRADGGGVDCLAALLKSIRVDENNTRLVWPLVTELCYGGRIDNRFLQAMMYAEPRLIDDKGAHRSLLEADNKRKLVDAGIAKIMRDIGECAAFYNRGGERVFAEGVLRVVNYRRQIKITLRGSKPLDAAP